MKRMMRVAAAVLGLGIAAAQAATQVVLQYPYPDLFNLTHKQIEEAFAKSNPGIKVTFRAPYQDYEDATQRVLREAVTGTVPDITLEGDVGNRAGHGLAEHALGSILVVLVRRSKCDLDAGIGLGERFLDLLVGEVEQIGIWILEHNLGCSLRRGDSKSQDRGGDPHHSLHLRPPSLRLVDMQDLCGRRRRSASLHPRKRDAFDKALLGNKKRDDERKNDDRRGCHERTVIASGFIVAKRHHAERGREVGL